MPATKKNQPAKKKKTSSVSKSQTKKPLKTAAVKTTKSKAKSTRKRLPGAFRLLGRSLVMLRNHWKLFLAISLVYGILNILLVRGLGGGTDLSSIKNTLEQAFHGSTSKLSTGFTVFFYLLNNSGNSPTADAGVYQTLLVILVSLALIWTLRQLYAGTNVKMRDAFYRGVYPLVPFILVLLVVGLELIPLAIGVSIFSIVNTNGISVGIFEEIIWVVVLILTAFISLYMVCSSIFALYVVTLPDMTPMKALRSARGLVKHRRWVVLRKALFLPVALGVGVAAIMLPLILFATPVAGWIYFALSMIGLAVIHSYVYALYRELLV